MNARVLSSEEVSSLSMYPKTYSLFSHAEILTQSRPTKKYPGEPCDSNEACLSEKCEGKICHGLTSGTCDFDKYKNSECHIGYYCDKST